MDLKSAVRKGVRVRIPFRLLNKKEQLTENQLEAIFEKYEDEFCEFHRIENPKHCRSDMCAMLMIDEIQSRSDFGDNQGNMISWAEHDVIHFDVNVENFSKVVTKEELIDLIRCGIRLEEGNFTMFV